MLQTQQMFNVLDGLKTNIKWHKFHSMNAYVGEAVKIGDEVVVPFKSYDTIVAYLIRHTYTGYKRGWYSVSTTRQINRWFKEEHIDNVVG